jgi:secreted trypsin-like serine protease
LIFLSKFKYFAATCKCGGPFSSSRIVGGVVVPPHSLPFQVGLTTTGDTVPFCGGSLISNNYVLTAAHCTIGRATSSIQVIVGDHSVSVTGDGEQYLNVQNVLVHPQYNPSNMYAYDYSILRLATSVTIPSATTGVVCLPPDVSQTFVGSTLTVSGWGLTSGGGFQSLALKSTVLTGISNDDCTSYFGSGNIGSWHICAIGNTTGSSACNGDSGGNFNSISCLYYK